MATAAIISPSSTLAYTPQTVQLSSASNHNGPQDVQTVLNYFKPNEDGSPPHPTYTDRPETYNRPVETHPVTVRDIRGRERDFTLDGNGFQVHRHTASEKDFLDDDKIKSGYYTETEQLLKEV
jgi:hypothetical protein